MLHSLCLRHQVPSCASSAPIDTELLCRVVQLYVEGVQLGWYDENFFEDDDGLLDLATIEGLSDYGYRYRYNSTHSQSQSHPHSRHGTTVTLEEVEMPIWAAENHRVSPQPAAGRSQDDDDYLIHYSHTIYSPSMACQVELTPPTFDVTGAGLSRAAFG
jgi:hypothetical protein